MKGVGIMGAPEMGGSLGTLVKMYNVIQVMMKH